MRKAMKWKIAALTMGFALSAGIASAEQVVFSPLAPNTLGTGGVDSFAYSSTVTNDGVAYDVTLTLSGFSGPATPANIRRTGNENTDTSRLTVIGGANTVIDTGEGVNADVQVFFDGVEVESADVALTNFSIHGNSDTRYYTITDGTNSTGAMIVSNAAYTAATDDLVAVPMPAQALKDGVDFSWVKNVGGANPGLRSFVLDISNVVTAAPPTAITFVMTNGVPALTGTAAGQASTSITNANVEVDGELYDVVLNVSGYTGTTDLNDGNIRKTGGGVTAGSLSVVGGGSPNALDIGEGANVDIVVLKAGEELNASFDITEFMIKGNSSSRDYSITDAAGNTSGAQGDTLVSPTSFTATSGDSVAVVMEPEAFNLGSSTDFAWNRPSGGTAAMGLYSISMFISDVTTGTPPAQVEFNLLDGISDAITNEAGIASHSITQANVVVDGQAYDVVFGFSGYTAAPTNGVAGLGNLALGYGPFSLNENSNDTTGGIGVIGLERGTIGRDYTFNASNPWDEGLNIDITVLSNGVEMAADFSLVEFKIVEGFPDTTRDYALFDEAGTTATNGGAQGSIIHQASNIAPDINGAVAVSMPDITSKAGIDFAWNRNNYGGNSIGNAMSMKSMTFQINSVTNFSEQFTSNGTSHSWLDSFPGLVVGGDYEAADAGDQDYDGFLTWQEYQTGTNPQDPESLFSFTAVESDGGAGEFIITWTSGEGSLFTLSSNINLSVGAWGVVASNIVGQANETSYTTTVGSAATFFDVELQ